MIKCDGLNGEVIIKGSGGVLVSEMEMIVMSIKEQLLKAAPEESRVVKGEFMSKLLRMCKYDSLEDYICSLENGIDVSVEDVMRMGEDL